MDVLLNSIVVDSESYYLEQSKYVIYFLKILIQNLGIVTLIIKVWSLVHLWDVLVILLFKVVEVS